MRIVRIKPEGFKYFHNTRAYYLSGTTRLLEDKNWLPEGKGVHFFFDKKILGDLDLSNATDLYLEVEPTGKEVIAAGRLVLRFDAIRIYEDNNGDSY